MLEELADHKDPKARSEVQTLRKALQELVKGLLHRVLRCADDASVGGVFDT